MYSSKKTKCVAGYVDFTLYHTPCTAFSVKQFLAKILIPVLDHQLYSPDLAPLELSIFPKLKISVNEYNFESHEDI
jgi:hypothetical protein